MTLTADKMTDEKTKEKTTTRFRPARPAMPEGAAEFAKSWAGATVTLSERDFDRLFRCNSYRLLSTGRGELRALFEHDGDGELYAILSAEEAVAESVRPLCSRTANAMRVRPADDCQEDTLPYTGGTLSPSRLQGMVVQHQGVGYVLTGSGVTFVTARANAQDLVQKRGRVGKPGAERGGESRLLSSDSRERESVSEARGLIPQGIKGNSDPKNPSVNVQVPVQAAVQEIPQNPAASQAPPSDISYCLLPLAKVGQSNFNPRENFDETKLAELAESIREHGILEPIVVRPAAVGRWILDSGRRRRDATGPLLPFWQILDTLHLDTVNKTYSGATVGPFWSEPEARENLPEYEIIAGERRWRASKLAGTVSIPALVRQIGDEKARTLAVIENLQRSDLNPLEEGRGFEILTQLGWSQAKIAEQVGCAQSRISKVMGLKRLPDAVQSLLSAGELSPSHGQRLLAFGEFPEVCVALAQAAAEKHWNVKQLEAPLGWDVVQALQEQKLAKGFSQWDTAFDYKAICVESCPFKAFRTSGSGEGVCLKPDHYHELQKEAKKQKADSEKGAAQKAVAAFQTVSLPMNVPTVTEGASAGSREETPASLPDAAFSASSPVLPTDGIPALSSLPNQGFVVLQEGVLEKRGGHLHETYTSVEPRPVGCSASCVCAGAARLQNGDVVSICTLPKRFHERQGAEQADKMRLREQRAANRLESAIAQIKETREEGLTVWEPEPVLRAALLYFLSDSFFRTTFGESVFTDIARRYGVVLAEGAVVTHAGGQTLTTLGWNQLCDECSVPMLCLMQAEIRLASEARDAARGYGGSGNEQRSLTNAIALLAAPYPQGRTFEASVPVPPAEPGPDSDNDSDPDGEGDQA